MAASRRHHRSPTSATKPAGQDLGAPLALGIDDSTVLLAAKCQYFLDNVIAQFGGIGAYNNWDGRRIVIGSNGNAIDIGGPPASGLSVTLPSCGSLRHSVVPSAFGVDGQRGALQARFRAAA
jgi:hypothetical protein